MFRSLITIYDCNSPKVPNMVSIRLASFFYIYNNFIYDYNRLFTVFFRKSFANYIILRLITTKKIRKNIRHKRQPIRYTYMVYANSLLLRSQLLFNSETFIGQWLCMLLNISVLCKPIGSVKLTRANTILFKDIRL